MDVRKENERNAVAERARVADLGVADWGIPVWDKAPQKLALSPPLAMCEGRA